MECRPSEIEKWPLTCYDGAEDGIRTRDPHLGKVVFFVAMVGRTSLSCCSVQPVSTWSTESVALVERSTNGPDLNEAL